MSHNSEDDAASLIDVTFDGDYEAAAATILRIGREDRLEYLRSQIDAECISMGELIELQNLAPYIEPHDVQMLEWAGVPEFPEEPTAQMTPVVTEEGATFTPWTDGHAVGFHVTAEGQPDRYIYLNPSGSQDSTDVNDTDAFLYLDGTGVDSDSPISFVTIWDKEN